jgi:hypothetical protein
MLDFFSSSTRSVNTERGVQECLESAMGSDFSQADLLIFHASIGHDFRDLVKEASRLAPKSKILAASCCGVVGREGVSESMKDIALMAIKGNEFAISHCNNIFGVNSYEKTLEMAVDIKNQKEGINMIYFLASGIDIANDECIRAIEDVFGDSVTIFGATSADNMKGVVNFQAVNNEVFEHGAYIVGFSDPTLSVETQATHGFVRIGEPLVVTKADGHIIKEFNGRPAWQEYTNRLGLNPDAECGDTIPIGALGEKLSEEMSKEYGNDLLLRVVTKRKGNDMYFATTIETGTPLWLTTRDEELIFSEMDRMVNDMTSRIGNKEVVAVFHADCLARGRFLFNRIVKEELVARMQFPFYTNGVCPPWLGMYGFGEIARLGGRNTYHNYTTALYVIYRDN